eukprot:TRINITY_DN3917_c0_g1_i2.p1 TRINITY_DN3917_c0_g1~~TRINITY_DN3917_c0_g1_i2.p1  ORF type:complete len:211 (-),score=44.19 TRINITY_DN3917_c0_g1_i2:575-1207(-)
MQEETKENKTNKNKPYFRNREEYPPFDMGHFVSGTELIETDENNMNINAANEDFFYLHDTVPSVSEFELVGENDVVVQSNTDGYLSANMNKDVALVEVISDDGNFIINASNNSVQENREYWVDFENKPSAIMDNFITAPNVGRGLKRKIDESFPQSPSKIPCKRSYCNWPVPEIIPSRNGKHFNFQSILIKPKGMLFHLFYLISRFSVES